MAVSNGYAYLADNEGGIQVVNITPPELANTVAVANTLGDAMGIAVSNGFAYVGNGMAVFQIININQPDIVSIFKRVSTVGRWGCQRSRTGHAYLAMTMRLILRSLMSAHRTFLPSVKVIFYAVDVSMSQS